MDHEKVWLTIKEAAAYTGMSIAFFRKAVRFRRVPFARIGTKALRFDRRALDSWLASNSCAGEFTYQNEGR